MCQRQFFFLYFWKGVEGYFSPRAEQVLERAPKPSQEFTYRERREKKKSEVERQRERERGKRERVKQRKRGKEGSSFLAPEPELFQCQFQELFSEPKKAMLECGPLSPSCSCFFFSPPNPNQDWLDLSENVMHMFGSLAYCAASV